MQLGLSMSALTDLPGSGSAGQLVYFGLTQICGNTCIQVLAHTGQVPVKSQVLTDILSTFKSSQYLQVPTNVYIVNMINLCSLLCKLYCTNHAWYCLVQWWQIFTMGGGSRYVEHHSLASLWSLTFLVVSLEIIHTCKVTISSDSLVILVMDSLVYSGF
jgi:hypothetical protein